MVLPIQKATTPQRSNRTSDGNARSPSILTPTVDNASNAFTPNSTEHLVLTKSSKKDQDAPPSSSCKRRRLSDEENMGGGETTSLSPSKLLSRFEEDINTKKHRREEEETDTDDSDDEGEEGNIEDAHNEDCAKLLQRIKRSNSGDKSMLGVDEQLIASIRGKLYQYVPSAVARMLGYEIPEDQEGDLWIAVGTGMVKFTKDLEEGITYGTIRMSMTDEGNLKRLLSHKIDPDSKVEPISNSSKGYTWKAVNEHTVRTLALRFSSVQDAMKWKDTYERSKRETHSAQMALVGSDAQDTSAGDEMAKYMKALSTGNRSPLRTSLSNRKAPIKKRRV